MTNLTLIENFQQYFSISIARTPEQKKDVFKIRYRVYCKEFNYEPIYRFPNGLEYDKYDDHSIHCLITHINSQMPAGCVRIIPTQGQDGAYPLPFEETCKDNLYYGLIEKLNLNRQTVCEISRLAVDGFFRRRSGEKKTRFGEITSLDISHKEVRTFSLIAVSCFLASNALAELTGRPNGFAMMEPYLPKLMNRSGIYFQKVGKEINYHGVRAPYFNNTQSVLKNMHPTLKELYHWIRTEIGKAYDPISEINIDHNQQQTHASPKPEDETDKDAVTS